MVPPSLLVVSKKRPGTGGQNGWECKTFVGPMSVRLRVLGSSGPPCSHNANSDKDCFAWAPNLSLACLDWSNSVLLQLWHSSLPFEYCFVHTFCPVDPQTKLVGLLMLCKCTQIQLVWWSP